MAQLDLDPPSLNTREGPAPFQPLLSRGSGPPPLITRGGSAPFQPLPAQGCLWSPPLITRGVSAPFQPLPVQGIWASPSNLIFQPLPAQGCLWSPPPITSGGSAPFQPLPAQGCLWSPPPLTRGALPPSYSLPSLIYQAWPLESQSIEKLSTRMDLEWTATSPAPWIMYVNYSCLILGSSSSNYYCILGWLTTTRNKRVSPCAFITFSRLVAYSSIHTSLDSVCLSWAEQSWFKAVKMIWEVSVGF